MEKTKYFVICKSSSIYFPLLDIDGSLAVFDTEEQAHSIAKDRILLESTTYKIYEIKTDD